MFECPPLSDAQYAISHAISKAIAPKKRMTVSEWADMHFFLGSKGSSVPGRWRTSRNELLREPLDCFSVGRKVKSCTVMFPIQLGKTEIARVIVGYKMTNRPGPIMVMLPGEVSRDKWSVQKLETMIQDCPDVRSVLTSINSREAANSKFFKDFYGGQLYLEHVGSPARAKSTSVETLLVDEYDAFPTTFTAGDDPGLMIEGRTSAFPYTSQMLFISSPGDESASRIWPKFREGDQRYRYVPCPHCGGMQPLEWSGLKFNKPGTKEKRRAWYVCRDCGAEIEEHHKSRMFAAGKWVAHNPGATHRSYTANCLYYAPGLGPTWLDMADMWLKCQDDPAALRTFVNDRLAQVWQDETARKISHDTIADRAEEYPTRYAPEGVLYITAGIDTQDNRLACQLVGWGSGMRFWVLDYVEFMGDPAGDEVWQSLAEWLSAPVQHQIFGSMPIDASWQDAGGHRTQHVYAWVRRAREHGVRRPMCGFGAKALNADILGKPRHVDLGWRGIKDPRGVVIREVGTIAAKDWLFARLGEDAEAIDRHQKAVRKEEQSAKMEDRPIERIEPPAPRCHFTRELAAEYWPGLTSESFNHKTGRYELKRGQKRNEPLDTFGYAFAAAHAPELRLHRMTPADWRRRETALLNGKTFEPTTKENPEDMATPKPLVRTAPKKPSVPNRWK